jgi:hypothetical protein
MLDVSAVGGPPGVVLGLVGTPTGLCVLGCPLLVLPMPKPVPVPAALPVVVCVPVPPAAPGVTMLDGPTLPGADNLAPGRGVSVAPTPAPPSPAAIKAETGAAVRASARMEARIVFTIGNPPRPRECATSD